MNISSNKKTIVVNVGESSISVYDENTCDRIDLFSNDEAGKEEAIKVVKELLGE